MSQFASTKFSVSWRGWAVFVFAAASLALATSLAAIAQDGSWIDRYQARVTATQNEQPHWVTPLVKAATLPKAAPVPP